MIGTEKVEASHKLIIQYFIKMSVVYCNFIPDHYS